MFTFLLPVLTVALFFSGMYLIALMRRDNSVADIAWGIGFILVGITGMIVNGTFTLPAVMVMGLVSIWGGRLALHIFSRNLGKGEDFRYQEMRKRWGSLVWLKSFVYVFLLQAVLLLIVSLPIQLVMYSSSPNSSLFTSLVGLFIWVIGFYFESVGDAQLTRFRSNPENKGKIITTGLWSYTRHPNYFGESLMWWGIAIIAAQVQYGYIGFIGALTITIMVRFVSGVPLLEKKYAGRADWEAYVKKTPVFFPDFRVKG